ncbi:dipeptidase [Streptomyces sp. NBC_01431]|uniref:dipeptidase n=2 Tax=Streptomyces TaxID=1883 RepID=UPI002E371407|nr:dipeptidase [Streptomyces sp. NBC_01431]
MPANALRERVHQLMGRAEEDLRDLVAHRSVADARQYPVEECERAALLVARLFTEAGIPDMRLLDTPDGSKAVFGHLPAAPGSPTVLLYSHYDVQPPLDEAAWTTPVWTLTERGDGRWYGRGAADCKGNIVMQLTALRALGDLSRLGIGIKVISEGAEEQSTGGLATLVRENPKLLYADTVLVCDTGNSAAGVPTATTDLRGVVHATVSVRSLAGPVHSGSFGGPAPDPLNALIAMLATLHDADGNTTVNGLDNSGRWQGADYPVERYRRDIGVRDGVRLMGDGTVADMLWARPALTVTGIDCPPVVGSAPAVLGEVTAKLNLRIPYGTDPDAAWQALAAHLAAAAPWEVEVETTLISSSRPFRSRTDGLAYAALAEAMREAFGQELTTTGQGGSIPVCDALQETFPDAEIALIGVEEPQCLIHAPDESVDPQEIERMALALAYFLQTQGEQP